MEKTFGDKVRDARISHGLSVAQLADRINVSPSMIRRCETDAAYDPKYGLVDALARELSIPISEIMCWEPIPDNDIKILGRKMESRPGGVSSRLRKILEYIMEDDESVF